MKSLLIISMLILSGVVSAQHLDGAWLESPTYGKKGDKVVFEVKAQIEAYEAAKAKATAIQSGEESGDLRAAQQECVNTALYTYVKAMYLAEMGRVALNKGDVAQAEKDYTQALAWAQFAQTVETNEERTKEKSVERGAFMEKICKNALAKIAKRK